MTLKDIKKANDIKKLKPEEYDAFAEEIRQFLIENISKSGGHLASNLGVVELTMALHLSFQLPTDKLIWDVGHQAYTHKLLTGRAPEFETLRQKGGISGFPKTHESSCDAFGTGHSSTSISAGLGIACARDLLGEKYHVVSIIGDGSMTGGMAFEALNNAAQLKSNFIIVLNDNGMSISPNVGSLSHYLLRLRTAKSYTRFKGTVNRALNKIPEVGDKMAEQIHRAKNSIKQLVVGDMYFENLGITYIGPVNGHDIPQMLKVFQEAKKVEGPVIVHVHTKKGKGYAPAEQNPSKFHGIGPFDPATGEVLGSSEKSWTSEFSDVLYEQAKKNRNLVAVTAAMADGTGLSKFAKYFPKRFYDVGIAEQHAVTFAAGLASRGLRPVVAVYSSFLQRAYDQILHDVCIQNLPVIFAVDRAGLVGADGETHQGIFDLSYLSSIPNLTVLAPKNAWELGAMFDYALQQTGPVAIRYPRGSACRTMEMCRQEIATGEAEILHRGSQIALLAVGSMVETARQAAEQLKEKDGLDVTVVNMRFVKPLDTKVLTELAKDHELYVTLEENVRSGGFGELAAAVMEEACPQVRQLLISLPDQYIEQGTPAELKEMLELDADGIYRRVRDAWKKREGEQQ